ncbi:MAG: hypothetical protein JWM69_931 [Candidatus Binatus sp.]|jgi:hypothetical protein|nr:hypothetical protein [Candidatus Binatus sp.]
MTRRLPMLTLSLLLACSLGIQGCSYINSYWKGDDTSDLDDPSTGEGEPLPPPVANISVSYKRTDDALVRATVIKFFGAEAIASHQRDANHKETVVRFEGGVPIWEFKTTESTIGSITGMGERKFALKSIEYAKLPQHFTQIIPEEGPPEPLDRGAYYVFQIERQSGSTSYQAVKILADGSLQAYNAQPRAGSSYLLCCNISPDFQEPVVLPEANPDLNTSNAPPEEPPSDHPDAMPPAAGGP